MTRERSQGDDQRVPFRWLDRLCPAGDLYVRLHEAGAQAEADLPLGEEGPVWGSLQGSCDRNQAALGGSLSVRVDGSVYHVSEVTNNKQTDQLTN